MKPKRSLALLRSLALVVFLASPISFTRAATSAAQPGDKFKLTWERLDLPENQMARKQWSDANERARSGMVSKEELAPLQFNLEHLESLRPYRFTLHSEGGTLREFLTALSRDKEVNLTLINAGAPSDLDLILPPFDVRNANWNMIVEVIANFVATRGLFLKIAGSDQANPDISKSVVCVMRPDSADNKRTADAGFESFQIGDYLADTQTIDEIVDAIRTGWGLVPGSSQDALRIKFHPATKLLLVSGPSAATQVAKQVLNGLRKKPATHP